MARTRHALRRWWPVLLAVAGVGGIVVAVNPGEVVAALRRTEVPLLVPVVLLIALAPAVQGMRWHFLLGAVGARIRMLDSVLLSVAGQGITALLPLGDLTRAIFATEVAGVEFADVVATVTVQELTFILFLLVAAGPVVVERHQAAGAEIVALVGVAVIATILLVPAVFHQVHRVAEHTPVLRRYIRQIDELQHETVRLLHDRRSMAWSLLDLLRVVLSITALWVLVRAITGGGGIGWASAAFVLALSYVGGAISLIPGGVGANEASTVGLLYVVGVHPAAAAAIAVLQRFLQSGTVIACALVAYALARRRHPDLSSITALRRPDPTRRALRAG
ncbi:MAG TPA: lysylphosphatidylglycerol synthase transmembrane domain-containing protein [Candidatus Dormibacteraeota bacterium]